MPYNFSRAESALSVILGVASLGCLVIPPLTPTPTQPTEIALAFRWAIGGRDPWGTTLAIWDRPWGRQKKNHNENLQNIMPRGLENAREIIPRGANFGSKHKLNYGLIFDSLPDSFCHVFCLP